MSEKRIVLGPRFVIEGLRAGTVSKVFVESGEMGRFRDVLSEARKHHIDVVEVPRAKLERMADGSRHQGVVAEAAPYHFYEVDELVAKSGAPFLLALDQITDPHNFGAILRSALIFGVDGVIVPKHGNATITPVVVRASAGASESIKIAVVTNLQRTLADLGKNGLSIIGLDGGGDTSIEKLPEAPFGRVLVVGSEGDGLRRMVRERCDAIAGIPQRSDFDSLNASVAAGIALYECARQR